MRFSLPNFQGKSPGIFPPDHCNIWHFLILNKPKDIIQQGFYIYSANLN